MTPPESTFRYSDLTIEGTDKDKYDSLQNLVKTLKQHINVSLTEAKTQYNRPHMTPLAIAFEALRKYYISASQTKLDGIISAYQELSTLVTSYTFPEPQISNFTSYIDQQQAKIVNAHTAFIASLHKLNIHHEDTTTPGHSQEKDNKFINRPDLAAKCKELLEEFNHTDTLDFLKNFENWFLASHTNPNDLKKKKNKLYQRLSRNLQTELSSQYNNEKNTYSELVQAIKNRLERKFPAKNRVLHFLNTTKQSVDQTLSEYIHNAHREATESGLHDGNWSTYDLESLRNARSKTEF